AANGRTFWNLTGTPPEAGTHQLDVHATDEAGGEQTTSISVNVTAPAAAVAPVAQVDPPPVDPPPDELPPVEPPPGDDVPPVVSPPVTPPVAEAPPPKGEVPEKLRRMIRSRMDAMSTQRLSPEMRIRI